MLALLLSSFVLAPQSPQATAPVQSLVTIDLASEGLSVGALQAADFDVAARRPGSPRVDLVCDADDLARLRERGVGFTVVHDDLARFYADRAAASPARRTAPKYGAWLTPPFGSGSMASYYTHAEVESVLAQVAAAYPGIVSGPTSIGTSIEGEELWAIKVSDNPLVDEAEPEVRFDGLHHAREPQSLHTNLWVLLMLCEEYGSDPLVTYLVDERELWFVPMVNPDGYEHNEATNPGGGGLWRKNRRDNGDGTFGVDLNRNYAFEWGSDDAGSSPSTSSETYRGTGPASEPEVAAMQAFIDARDFETALTAHSYSNLWLYPWGYVAAGPANEAEFVELSILATAINGYVYGPAAVLLYLANGVTDDYDFGVHGTLCWTPEIGDDQDGFWPDPARIEPLAIENEQAFLRTALAAGAYLHEESLTLVDLGDGDGNLEPGEAFDVVVGLRNSGRRGATVDLSLSSGDPGVTITGGAVALGAVASFTSADNAGAPLSLSLGAGLVPGTAVTLTTTVSWEGYAAATDHTFVVGEAQLYLVDDVEVDLGWTVGLPGDTATTGLWEFGDPVGTDNNGEPLNPEDDASVAGVNAFTTGNGSTSAGGDDVDDGVTTLITPALDLSAVTSAEVAYSRWYSNQGSPADDDLVVSISDDGGASWVPLETVAGNPNAWTRVAFLVEDFVALTDEVRLRFEASDDPNNSLTEASIDELEVTIYDAGPKLNLYGRPAIGTPFSMHLTGTPGERFVVYTSPGTASITLPGVVGEILLDPSGLLKLGGGTVPGNGLVRIVSALPNDPGLVGTTAYVQAATVTPPRGRVQMSNLSQLVFQ